jgi:hypothetical protein
MHAEIINATANNARVSCKGGGRRAYPEDIELVVEAHGAEIKGWRRKCPKRRLHRPIQHDADERAPAMAAPFFDHPYLLPSFCLRNGSVRGHYNNRFTPTVS